MKLKKRIHVKKVDFYYSYEYHCRYCHNEVESVDHMLVRLSDELDKRVDKSQLMDFKDWIRREAVERYPKSSAKKKAFKAGVYALLDRVGFDYEIKED